MKAIRWLFAFEVLIYAHRLTDLGLIDEYLLCFRPFVLGRGAPFFAGPGRRSAL